MMWLMWAFAAMAGVPEGLEPALAPLDAPEQFAEHQRSLGKEGALACAPLWPGEALLCFRQRVEGGRRWVTAADLATWSTTTDALRDALVQGAPAHLAELVRADLGQGQSYWQISADDGWEAAGVLAPDALQERLGAKFVLAAVPAQGLAIYWAGGDAELDRMVGVGVRDLYEEAPGSVSPTMHRWDGRRWHAYAAARKIPKNPQAPATVSPQQGREP